MFCTKCGCQLMDGASFCVSCGAPVGRVRMEASSSVGSMQSSNSKAKENDHSVSTRKSASIIAFSAVISCLIITSAIIFALKYRQSGSNQEINNSEGTSKAVSFEGRSSEKDFEKAETVSDIFESSEYDKNVDVSPKKPGDTVRIIENTSADIPDTDLDKDIEEEYLPEREGGDFIIPDSDTRVLSKTELEGLSAEECRLARNEIYARHGRRFKDDELQKYFDSKSWYKGTVLPDEFTDNMLSEVETANRDIIVEYEKSHGFNR